MMWQRCVDRFSSASAALETYARAALDRSDGGALATLAEFAYRPLKAKVASLKKVKKKE